MNKKILFAFAFLVLSAVLFSTQLASAYYGYSYTDSYSKTTTYTPYGQTTEIRKDTPSETIYYYKSQDYYSNYPHYNNKVYSYLQYGPNYYPRVHYVSPYYSDSNYRSSYNYRGHYAPQYYDGYYNHRY